MYAIINEEVITEYPVPDIRARFSNISFPAQIESHHLPPNIVKIEPSPVPNVGRTQFVSEGKPIKNGSTWMQVWEIHNKDDQQIQNDNVAKITSVRNQRNEYLNQTDWMVTRATETSSSVPAPYAAYRQALRDITNQPGFPWEVKWPDKP